MNFGDDFVHAPDYTYMSEITKGDKIFALEDQSYERGVTTVSNGLVRFKVPYIVYNITTNRVPIGFYELKCEPSGSGGRSEPQAQTTFFISSTEIGASRLMVAINER